MRHRFENVTGFLLAGGASRRMGQPKAGLMLGGETMLSRQIRLLGAVSRQVFVVLGRKEKGDRRQETEAREKVESGVRSQESRVRKEATREWQATKKGNSREREMSEALLLTPDSSLLSPSSDGSSLLIPSSILADELPNRGPLAGIATALASTRTEFNLIVGCDLPSVEALFLRFLCRRAIQGGADVTLPVSQGGTDEPLCAVYHRRALRPIRTALAAGQNKVTRWFRKARVERIMWREIALAGFPAHLFDNMNTLVDYEAAQRRFSAGCR